MKYSETGFRAVYHNFCIFPLNESVKSVIEGFPGFKDADGVLAYGYYDRTAGLTLEMLCCTKEIDTNTFTFAKSPEDIRGLCILSRRCNSACCQRRINTIRVLG